jgi:ABC-type polysaccharide/polyol phosphate transport system ATPase subunit
MQPAVEFRNVTKSFPRSSGRMLIKQHLSRLLTHRGGPRGFQALTDVSFSVAPGEGLAVVGSNGAGKSTLLSLIVGLTRPNLGTVEVNGRIAALLELGSGFHPDLTGMENVFLNASLLGLSERQTKEHFDSIVDFSGVRDFINQPLRTYSSGMVVRLAFSVAVNMDPDILVIDEILAVGDAEFQAKCSRRIQELRDSGKTFICVSHSPQMLGTLCQTAIWLDHGRVRATGSLDNVLHAYSERPPVSV